MKQTIHDEPVKSPRLASQIPVPSGAGFFTPEAQNAFRYNTESKNAFRINAPGPRDSLYVFFLYCAQILIILPSRATNDSTFILSDSSFVQTNTKISRIAGLNNQPLLRPLSSADEAGPAPKKARSISRRPAQDDLRHKQSAPQDTRNKKVRPSVTSRVNPLLKLWHRIRLLQEMQGPRHQGRVTSPLVPGELLDY